MIKICPFCNQLMTGFPKEFPGLNVEPHVLRVLFMLWRVYPSVLTYAQIGGNEKRPDRHRAYVYVEKLRIALRKNSAPWLVDVARNVGVRLVKIESKA